VCFFSFVLKALFAFCNDGVNRENSDFFFDFFKGFFTELSQFHHFFYIF